MAHKLEKNIEATYKQSLSRRYNRVQLIGLPSLKDNRDLWLEEIYVPLGFTRKPGGDEERFYLPQALSESRRLVILGDPGSGKSTLVKLITHAFGRSTSSSLPQHFGPLLPIPIILRDYKVGEWNNYEDMLRDFIKQLDEEIRDSVTVEWLTDYLAKGQAIVLLDGIDEIGSAEARRHLRDNVVFPLVEKFPDNFLILTSRIIGYEEVRFDLQRVHLHASWEPQPNGITSETVFATPAFPRCYVAPFNNEDIEQFITRWYTARETDSAQRSEGIEALKRALAQNDRVKRLANNPSLLTLIALIFRVTADLPSGRVKLYDKITEAYLETIEKFRGVGQFPATLEQKRRWLARVGWEMQSGRDEKQKGDLLVSREQVKKWLTEAISEERENAEAEAETFLDYIARRSGLLIPRGVDDAGNDQFSFVHLTFQEYFAALHLSGMAWDFGEVVNHCLAHLTHRYWHETIVVLFEMLADQRGSGDRLVKILIEKAEQPDEEDAAAEIFSELLLDGESGLNLVTQELATTYVLDVSCEAINETIVENLKGLSQSNFDHWVAKPMLDQLCYTNPDEWGRDFLLLGDELLPNWPESVKESIVTHSDAMWPHEYIATVLLISTDSKEAIRWASNRLPLHYWLRPGLSIVTEELSRNFSFNIINIAGLNLTLLFDLSLSSQYHSLLAQFALAQAVGSMQFLQMFVMARSPALSLEKKSNQYITRCLENLLDQILGRSLDNILDRSLDRSSDKTLPRSVVRYGSLSLAMMSKALDSIIPRTLNDSRRELIELINEAVTAPSLLSLTLPSGLSDNTIIQASADAEWLAFQPDREGERLTATKRSRRYLKTKDDWTRLLAINNLVTLSAGTPDLIKERNRLCDLAMKTPEKFTFPDELVEATKDKEWFNLPEIIAIIFLHEPGDPFLKPEWFDPKREESKFFLSPPREFFALAAEVLDPEGKTDLAKWRKS